MAIIYTEDLTGATVQRYYYAHYDDKNRANEDAMRLENKFPWFHNVCDDKDAVMLGVQYLPLWLKKEA